MWEHFQSQDAADEWIESLNRLPVLVFGAAGVPDFDVVGCAMRAAVILGARLTAADAADAVVDDAPPGWSAAELLAEAKAFGGDSTDE